MVQDSQGTKEWRKQASKEVNIELPRGPTVPLPDMHPKELNAGI